MSCPRAGLVVCLVGGDEPLFKTVRGHHVGLPSEELDALPGGDVAHRGEAIDVQRGLLLDGVLGHHVERARHLVAIVRFQMGVKGQVVAGDGAPHGGSVRGEDGGYLGHVFLDVERTGTRHPLVEVGDHVLRLQVVEAVEVLDKHPRGVGEDGRLVVVTVGREGIHPEVGPHLGVDVVLQLEERFKLHQEGYRAPRHVPPAGAYLETAVRPRVLPPGPVQVGLLDEPGVLVALQVGTDKKHAVLVEPLQRVGAGG